MSEEKYDAILVLGGGINLDGSLPDVVKVQVQEAVNLFELHCAQAFITSGLYGYKSEQKPIISEAKACAKYAENLGINLNKIYIEERSQETLGNILFTKMEILIPNNWTKILVVPQINHLTERIEYLMQKILGQGYEWTIVRPNINLDEKNIAREKKSLELTMQINDAYKDGDHDAIYEGLMASHPAYGGTLRTIKELRDILG
jgi:hypothetical protein